MKNFLVLALTILTLGQTQVAQANIYEHLPYFRDILECGPTAKYEITKIKKYLEKNINDILYDPNIGDLTYSKMRQIKKQLAKVRIRCSDHRSMCKSKDGHYLLGREAHILKFGIRICYENIRTLYGKSGFCKLASTVLHEAGHSADVPMDPNHNDGPNGDPVYRLGKAAYDHCLNAEKGRSLAPKI